MQAPTVPALANPTLPLSMFSKLKTALGAAVAESVSGLNEVGVPFSGGLDSTLLLVLARKYCTNVVPITIGTAGSSDIGAAKKVAGELGLENHSVREFSREEIAAAGKRFEKIWKPRERSFDLVLGTSFLLVCEEANKLSTGKMGAI